METMIAAQEKTADTMTTATENYATVVENSTDFTEAATSLVNIIKVLDIQRQHLHSSVKELATLIESAKTGLPDIEEKITTLVTHVTNGVEKHSQSMEDAINTTATSMDNLLSQTNSRFNKHIEDLSEKTRQQVNDLDQAMTDELTRSLESFGKQLAALSEKFVTDYTPLTEKLRQLVALPGSV
jgi:ABC-type transporter Mla subunit MlaD